MNKIKISPRTAQWLGWLAKERSILDAAAIQTLEDQAQVREMANEIINLLNKL